MLSAIFSALGGQIIDSFFGKALDAFKAYQSKQITEAELKAKISIAMQETFRAIEISHADALTKTFESFMQAASKSSLIAGVWAAVTITQLLVLLFHQIGIPAIVALGIVDRYPSSGTTVDWAYALLFGCLGLGPMVLRSMPGASLADKIRGLVK